MRIDDGIGICLMSPYSLLRGHLPSIKNSIYPTTYFISLARLKHGDVYDYSNSIYVSTRDKIKINCSLHGQFEQAVQSHLNGSGCPICGQIKTSEKRLIYTKGIEKGIVYCIEMEEEDGTKFYKIGFTRHSVQYRFNTKKESNERRVRMPYKYKVIFELVLDYALALKKENELQKLHSKYHYIPSIPFDGSATECFSKLKSIKIN